MKKEQGEAEDKDFEVRSGRASGKRTKEKVDSSSHSESEHEKETYMVGMQIWGLKEGAGCGALSEKHTVARWIKNEVGEVKVIDMKMIQLDGRQVHVTDTDGKIIENLGAGCCDGYIPSDMFSSQVGSFNKRRC